MRLLVLSLCLLLLPSAAATEELSLWYNEPAGEDWNEALPLGNGSQGVMVWGGVAEERLMYNLDSLWTGWPNPNSNREGSFTALERVRELLAEGQRDEAWQVMSHDFLSTAGYKTPDFGAFQAFCDARLSFPHEAAEATNYRRELNLETGLAEVRYRLKGVDYRRETLASYPDQLIATRLEADQLGSVSFILSLESRQADVKIEAKENQLSLVGQINNGADRPEGMKFAGRWLVQTEGGSVNVGEDGRSLEIENADAATLIFTGATNYRLHYPDYRGKDPSKRVAQALNSLASRNYTGYENLRAAHLADYQALFSRLSLDLGEGRSELPTDERVAAYRADPNDLALETLMFQYGRYLLIACSRPGSLPANLQGLWNNSNNPPWLSDYHLNINFEMNYWPVDLCNLSECIEPMVAWIEDLAQPGAETARIHYNSPGWVAHISGSVWGSTSPGPARGPQMIDPAGAAFICQNLWSHWDFTRDRDYLKRIWPLLRGASEFWLANLQQREDGTLYVSPSYSPEQGPMCDSAYFQPLVVWDLFGHTAEAAAELGIEPDFAAELMAHQLRLIAPAIGEFGQLLEWSDPELEGSVGDGVQGNQHRHFSHLYSVYPGEQIVTGRDPELIEAARTSMNFRGDGATGWSLGWKVNMWARLLDGDRAHKLMRNFIGHRTATNLWCLHPPFQIDGNFGYSAGVAEMLLQSHSKQIALLPALPQAWSEGSVQGICARGGFELDLSWSQGQLESVTVRSERGGASALSWNAVTLPFELKPGGKQTWSAKDFTGKQ